MYGQNKMLFQEAALVVFFFGLQTPGKVELLAAGKRGALVPPQP
jgi:hypothetical protein